MSVRETFSNYISLRVTLKRDKSAIVQILAVFGTL